jgi:hypothetical protein
LPPASSSATRRCAATIRQFSACLAYGGSGRRRRAGGRGARSGVDGALHPVARRLTCRLRVARRRLSQEFSCSRTLSQDAGQVAASRDFRQDQGSDQGRHVLLAKVGIGGAELAVAAPRRVPSGVYGDAYAPH